MDVGMQAPLFLILLLQIIGVNIVLSGDNAVVIALAARGLPPQQQKRAIAWGSGAAVIMRVLLTLVAVQLLQLPYLKLIGGLLLLWIAVKLLVPESGEDADGEASTGFAGAIRTILLADLAMSIDNVIAVAAVAKGNVPLLVIGLAISIPLVVFASQLLLGLMERFPFIITAGAALLGWVAGEMFVSERVIQPFLEARGECVHFILPAVCALGVVLAGNYLAARVGRRKIEVGPLAAGAPSQVAAGAPPKAAARHLLLAVDGSPGSLAAVRKVIAIYAERPQAGEVQVDLINVQRGVPSEAASFVPRGALQEYHRERSETALREPAALLEAAGIPYARHQFIGDPGRVIAAFAQEHGVDEIVMGTRGLGTHTGALLGSVTRSTLENASVPVLVVK
jgi:YjbE family integral membrane protein